MILVQKGHGTGRDFSNENYSAATVDYRLYCIWSLWPVW